MDHIGIDLGTKESQMCSMSEAGEIEELRFQTNRLRLKEIFSSRPKARILIEASTESEWIARCLEEMGHEAIVGDPNYAPMYAQRSRKVKTDRRDARSLMHACKLGAYRPAHRPSDQQRHVRAFLAVREVLVRTRGKLIVLAKSLLRREGIKVPSGASESFHRRIQQVTLTDHLQLEVKPLLMTLAPLNDQIAGLDKVIAEIATRDEATRRLMTCPQIGPVTAAAFVAALDGAERFTGPHQVESYLGLVPCEWSSSEIQRKGPITKAGSPRVRYLLVEAACRILRFPRPETKPLCDWADRIVRRRGKQIARVALARRLAGILYAMLRDKTDYEPAKLGHRNERAVAA